MAEGDLPSFAVNIPFFVTPCVPFASFGWWRGRNLAGEGNGLAVPLEAVVLEDGRTLDKAAMLGHAG